MAIISRNSFKHPKYLFKEIVEFNSLVLLSDVENLCDSVEFLCDIVESVCIIFVASPWDFAAFLCDFVKLFLLESLCSLGELSIGHVLSYTEQNCQ